MPSNETQQPIRSSVDHMPARPLPPAVAGCLATLRAAGEEVAALLRRHENQRVVERERSEALDRVEARAQAKAETRLQELRRGLHEADRRWRAKRGSLHARAAVPSLPMCVPQPAPEPRPEPVERTGGWWDDPVAAEVIEYVDGTPLADEDQVRRVRVHVARRLHPDRPGNEVYGPLLTAINELLDGALERIRAGVPDEVPGR